MQHVRNGLGNQPIGLETIEQIKLALAMSGVRAVLKNLLVGCALLVAFRGGRRAAQSLDARAAAAEPITPFIGKPRLGS